MAQSISQAMKLLEAGRLDEAASAFGGVEGAIARFRRAECLSRLGRHDAAIADARRAVGEEPGGAPAALWLAQVLAEAGQFDEAAGVELPDTPVESLAPLRAGFAALARIAAGDRSQAMEDVQAVLDARHSPLYSIALRVCETERLSSAPRWPDLPSAWYAIECRLEMEDLGQSEHPAVPRIRDPAQPTRSEARAATKWLRIHCSCGDHTDVLAALRRAEPTPDGLDEAELELHLAHGRIDAAGQILARLVEEAGDSAAGEVCLDRARIAQVLGQPARPQDFPGAVDARRRLGTMVTWLDLGAAILTEQTLAARPLADRISDPAHREFVEAALNRWATPPQRG